MKKYTHLGWFGFCPVYLGGIHTDCPDVAPRYRWLTPVLHLAIWLQEVSIGFCSLINPDWEPQWKILVTRKLT